MKESVKKKIIKSPFGRFMLDIVQMMNKHGFKNYRFYHVHGNIHIHKLDHRGISKSARTKIAGILEAVADHHGIRAELRCGAALSHFTARGLTQRDKKILQKSICHVVTKPEFKIPKVWEEGVGPYLHASH